jgi:hypothetical protein
VKAYIIITAVVAGIALLAAACERRAGPTAAEPTGVTGTVEVRLDDQVYRYRVRSDRLAGRFQTALEPLSGPAPLAQRLAAIPFVRDSGPFSADPIVMATPSGTIETRLAYRALGPWKVLDRATTAIRVRAPGGERTVTLEVALREPRLEH